MWLWDGHVWLIQPVAHTTSRDFLADSTGALEVLLKYIGRIGNALFNFLITQPSNTTQHSWSVLNTTQLSNKTQHRQFNSWSVLKTTQPSNTTHRFHHVSIPVPHDASELCTVPRNLLNSRLNRFRMIFDIPFRNKAYKTLKVYSSIQWPVFSLFQYSLASISLFQ